MLRFLWFLHLASTPVFLLFPALYIMLFKCDEHRLDPPEPVKLANNWPTGLPLCCLCFPLCTRHLKSLFYKYALVFGASIVQTFLIIPWNPILRACAARAYKLTFRGVWNKSHTFLYQPIAHIFVYQLCFPFALRLTRCVSSIMDRYRSLLHSYLRNVSWHSGHNLQPCKIISKIIPQLSEF